MKKTKKIPLRTCVVTRNKHPKQELIRIVRTPDGQILVDTSGKINGRGVYLEKSLACIEKAQKSKIIGRHLEAEISDEIYQKLSEILEQE